MNWDYLAGFFDGEGTVHFVTLNGRRYARVGITQNDRPILEEIKTFLNSEGYHRVTLVTSRHSPLATPEHTELKVNAQVDILRLLQQLLPLAHVKRDKISETIREMQVGQILEGDLDKSFPL